MQIQKGKIFDLIMLGTQEELPTDLNCDKPAIVQQGINTFLLQKDSLNTILKPYIDDKKEEFIQSQFGENIYDEENIYLLNSDLHNYKLDVSEFRYVMKYFREIFDKHACEAAVILLINTETKKWKTFFVPQIDCSKTAVHYLIPIDSYENLQNNIKKYYEALDDDENGKQLMEECRREYNKLLDDGWALYGTIHSHCDFSAFHSRVDDADEKFFDGLHITIGNVDDKFSFSARFMLGGAAWECDLKETLNIDPELLVDDIDEIEVLEKHMALMMPDIKPKRYAAAFSSPNTTWANLHNGFHGNWGESWFNNDDDDDDYEENVLEIDDCIKFYDLLTGKIIFARDSYVYINREKFPKHRFIEMEHDQIPKEALIKHQEYLNEVNDLLDSEEEEEEEIDPDELGQIYLFDSPILNANYPDKNNAIGKSQRIEDIETYQKNNRKARKKENSK